MQIWEGKGYWVTIKMFKHLQAIYLSGFQKKKDQPIINFAPGL